MNSINLQEEYAKTEIAKLLNLLDEELVGLAPVKARIREIAALLLIDKLRKNLGITANSPGLHMSFTGSPGTGKTTVGLKMADILFQLGYIKKGHLLTVTRDDLVGQYIGHTAPKTKEVLKKAMGGVLFIDEAYYLYKPDNERDYGSEAIEILLQVMENQRDDLVVILAGYKEPMDKFYESNPGLSSRIANHIDFPDYSTDELLKISKLILEEQQYQLTPYTQQPSFEQVHHLSPPIEQVNRIGDRRVQFDSNRNSARPSSLLPTRHPSNRGGDLSPRTREIHPTQARTPSRRSPPNPTRSRRPYVDVQCPACHRRGHHVQNCDMLAMAISLNHYIREQLTPDMVTTIETNWLERHRSQLDNIRQTPRQVLRAYADAYNYTTADIENSLDWDTWDDTPEPFVNMTEATQDPVE